MPLASHNTPTYLKDSRVWFDSKATCSLSEMCKQFKFPHHEFHPYWKSHIRELKSTEQVKNDFPEIAERDEKDILASSTEGLRFTFQHISSFYTKIKETNCFKILTSTTQPVHIAIMVIALTLAASLQSTQNSNPNTNNTLYRFIYVATTAVHFGSQIWMTFVSGLSLYFSLPRHHFGEVQKVLFPLYFTLTSLLSLVTLLAHLQLTKAVGKTLLLFLCFIVEFIVRLYFCDPLVRLICVKNDMEAKHGLGMEIGKLSRNSALFQSHEYLTVHRRFRRLHMFIAFSNIACIGFSTAHLYLAASDVSLGS